MAMIPLRCCGEPVELEELEERRPSGLGGELRGEELAAELRLLRGAAIAEVEQNRVEQAWVDRAGLPARVEVARHFLVGDEAAVEIHA